MYKVYDICIRMVLDFKYSSNEAEFFEHIGKTPLELL
jgi:hypothetical protein